MQRLVRVALSDAFIRSLERGAHSIRLKDGGKATGYRVKAKDDGRYYEKVEYPGKPVAWYELARD